MPMISQGAGGDYLAAYNGYDQQQVGLGLLNPSIYATPKYQKKKINNLMIGGISSFSYGGAEVDPVPTALIIAYEPRYSTIIGVNLHYLTQSLRTRVMKYVLESNMARIKSNLPILIDWHALKRAVPDIQYATRRYKVIAVALKETYTLMEWPEVAKQKSPYDGYYKVLKG